MGTVWSSLKLRREERAEYKRKLKRRLEEAEEYIDLLQETHQQVKNFHAQNHIIPDSMPATWKAYIDSRTVQMEEEIRKLKRTSYAGEMGLEKTKERCDSLEKEIRGLQQKEVELKRETLKSQKRLSDLRSNQKACQLLRFQRDRPLISSSSSLPDLHFTGN